MIELVHVSISAGKFALRDISFTVPTGQYAVLMGKTGTGKTTLLEVICRLRTIHSGDVRIAGRSVLKLAPAECAVGYVPQDLALFPQMTVIENLSFALTVRHQSPAQIRQRVQEVTALLGIEHLLKRYPVKLSGGEAQRVALGRALAFRPQVLLLDEPLSALDEETRLEMHDVLRTAQRETGVTVLHVTHSPSEAAALGQQLLRLQDGQVVSVR